MSSSTSSSRAGWRAELPVAVTVLALLLGAEAALRLGSTRLSLNAAHVAAIPSALEALASRPHPRVLFLGNSQTRHGVDTLLIEEELRQRGIAASIAKIHPDDTGITEWSYLFAHLVAGERAPDLLLIGFSGTILEDRGMPREQLLRVAQHYSALSDLPDIFARDVTDWESRAEFLLGKASTAFASRELVQRRALARSLPLYAPTARRLNRALADQASRRGASPVHGPTYEHLERLLLTASERGVRVWLVTMPRSDRYPVAAGLRELIARHPGVVILDPRTRDTFEPDAFLDGLHLTPDGAKRFSGLLVEDLAAHAQDLREGTR